ncbi:MAG: glycosyltransferase [Methanomethylophilus sp.]|jgi:biofilm PGA synthesis N-glycosyltransferase PgaC
MSVLKTMIKEIFYGRHGQAMRYLFFGFLNVVVTWASYALLVLAGIDPAISNVISWVIGVTFAFVVNKIYVFESKTREKKKVGREATYFTISRIITGCISIFGFPVLYDLGMDQTFLGVDGFVAKIFVSCVEIVLNYVFSKYWVFRNAKRSEVSVNAEVSAKVEGREVPAPVGDTPGAVYYPDPNAPAHIDVTVGICAYNEEQIIERAIRSISAQKTDFVNVKEVLVVSSGSTDRTDDIVRGLMKEFPKLRLYRQEKREGKNSAINCYLDNKQCQYVVMLNADNVFGTEDSLEKLMLPFRDPKVGITGGRPVPTNDTSDKIGFAVNLMWTVHHELALQHAKIGELIAFRDIGTRLRTDMQSDEDYIRMKLEEAGYRCVYVPDSIIRNRGPETLEDFMKQRVRVNIGECTMKKYYDYDVPTWNKKFLVTAALDSMHELGFHPFKMLYAARLERKARNIAREHVERGDDNMSVWDRVDSTKKL